MTRRDLFRLNCNLPRILIERVDEFAKAREINRSTALVILLNKALDEEDNSNG